MHCCTVHFTFDWWPHGYKSLHVFLLLSEILFMKAQVKYMFSKYGFCHLPALTAVDRNMAHRILCPSLDCNTFWLQSMSLPLTTSTLLQFQYCEVGVVPKLGGIVWMCENKKFEQCERGLSHHWRTVRFLFMSGCGLKGLKKHKGLTKSLIIIGTGKQHNWQNKLTGEKQENISQGDQGKKNHGGQDKSSHDKTWNKFDNPAKKHKEKATIYTWKTGETLEHRCHTWWAD